MSQSALLPFKFIYLFIFCADKEIKQVLFLKVPEARKALLLSEVDRVAQVYNCELSISLLYFSSHLSSVIGSQKFSLKIRSLY